MVSDSYNVVTYIAIIIMVISFIGEWLYIHKMYKQNKLIEKKQWIEQLPSIISTIGVLGTFCGITIGLYNFEASDLDNSIPLLLVGLKTAFVTSIGGMIGSMILSRVVRGYYEKDDAEASDINVAATIISNSMKDIKDANAQNHNALLENIVSQKETQAASLQVLQMIKDRLDHTNDIKLAERMMALQARLEENSLILNNLLNSQRDTHRDMASFFTQSIDEGKKFLEELKTFSGNTGSSLEKITDNQSMVTNVNNSIVQVLSLLERMEQNYAAILSEEGQNMAKLSSTANEIKAIADKSSISLETIKDGVDSGNSQLKNISSDTANIASINDNVILSVEALGNLDLSEQHVSEEIDKLGQKNEWRYRQHRCQA